MVENTNQNSNEEYTSGLSITEKDFLANLDINDISVEDLNDVDYPSGKANSESKNLNSVSGKPQDKVVDQKKEEIIVDKN